MFADVYRCQGGGILAWEEFPQRLVIFDLCKGRLKSGSKNPKFKPWRDKLEQPAWQSQKMRIEDEALKLSGGVMADWGGARGFGGQWAREFFEESMRMQCATIVAAALFAPAKTDSTRV